MWRGKRADFNILYVRTIFPEQRFEFGELRLTARETPGHTDDSISVVLTHLATGDSPAGVFTGDAI
ncbi:MAG: hypothetical protein H7147_11320 [Frankiaceae bacterium]|nr:hypothetical protein [Arenimonas sp.]